MESLKQNRVPPGAGNHLQCIALLFLFLPSASCPVGLRVQSFHVQAWSHPLEEWGAPDLSTQALGIFGCLSASSPSPKARPSGGSWCQARAVSRPVCVRVRHCHVRLCNPIDCSLPGSSVHGIFEARTLEQVAVSSSRGSSPPWD